MTTAAERHELAAFLRSRRRRRSPADAGLVTGRRRSPGLRREDVAALAGVSVTWYAWLEQARDVHPSEQVLRSLARALALDETETAHLFRLAGHRPPVRDETASDDVPTAYRMLLDQLDPCPAMVTNHRFDVLAWNRGHTAMFGDFARYQGDERNMLWYTFIEPEARKLVIDWADAATYGRALPFAGIRPAVDRTVHPADRTAVVGLGGLRRILGTPRPDRVLPLVPTVAASDARHDRAAADEALRR